MKGSPPHVRGKAGFADSRRGFFGITPAHAGKSQLNRQSGRSYQDHPRTCGEKQSVGAGTNGKVGSPPHMRGKATAGTVGNPAPGITPAHAGKRRRSFSGLRTEKDHPRTCGEKRTLRSVRRLRVGSPPHMRGKARRRTQSSLQGRITPAHAGKRSGSRGIQGGQKDHPRTCGEKTPAEVAAVAEIGSPPHMRGKD